MKRRRGLLWGLFAASAFTLTGCNLVSNPSLMTQSLTQRQVDPTGLQHVLTALQTMADVQTYKLKASLQVTTGRFVRTVNYYGSVALPNTISMDETIGNSNYPIYQAGSFAYYMSGATWQPMTQITDLTPWDSLAALLKKHPPKVVYALPQQVVTSWPCYVYQFKSVTTGSLLAPSTAGVGKHTIPHTALYTVWVNILGGRVRQVEVQSTVGVPALGTAAIDATELYFGVNSPMQLTAPSGLLTQLERP